MKKWINTYQEVVFLLSYILFPYSFCFLLHTLFNFTSSLFSYNFFLFFASNNEKATLQNPAMCIQFDNNLFHHMLNIKIHAFLYIKYLIIFFVSIVQCNIALFLTHLFGVCIQNTQKNYFILSLIGCFCTTTNPLKLSTMCIFFLLQFSKQNFGFLFLLRHTSCLTNRLILSRREMFLNTLWWSLQTKRIISRSNFLPTQTTPAQSTFFLHFLFFLF